MSTDTVFKDAELGWILIEGAPRGLGNTAPRYKVRGQQTQVSRATIRAAEYLNAHGGRATRAELAAHLRTEHNVSVALGEIMFALQQQYGAHKAGQIFQTGADGNVVLQPFDTDFVFAPDPAAPPARRAVPSVSSYVPRAKAIVIDDEDDIEGDDIEEIAFNDDGSRVERPAENEEDSVEDDNAADADDGKPVAGEAEEEPAVEAAVAPVAEVAPVTAQTTAEAAPAPVKAKKPEPKKQKGKAKRAFAWAKGAKPAAEPVAAKPAPKASAAKPEAPTSIDMPVVFAQDGSAVIDGKTIALSAGHAAVLRMLFNHRDRAVSAREIGAAVYPTHQRGEKTAYAAVFTLRGKFKSAGIQDAERIITTLPNKQGFRYTGAKAPGLKK